MNPANVTDNSSLQARPQKITEALRVLDQAIMNDGADLKDLVSKDYSHLQNAIKDLAPQVLDSVRASGRQTLDKIQSYAAPAMQKTKQAATQVDAQVKSHPWRYIAGAAVGALAVGFLLGRSANK
jgi:ElaB/YqjD/DUF883 family membrane-anchored ribosome-binding protein